MNAVTGTKHRPRRIVSREVKFNAPAAEAGDLYEVTCPTCKDTVRVAASAQWWRTVCRCGYEWRVHVGAIGERTR